MDKNHKWDAKRLVQEYVKIAWVYDWNSNNSFEKLSWSNQIRVKRIAAVLRAYFEMKGEEEQPFEFVKSVLVDSCFNQILEYSPMQDKDHERLLALVKNYLDDKKRFDYLILHYNKRLHLIDNGLEESREFMLRFFLEFRQKTDSILSYFNGVLETPVSGVLAIQAIKGLYFPNLRENNDKLDDMIVLLLGEKFKKSFTQDELQADYGYPKETDDELEQWDADNW